MGKIFLSIINMSITSSYIILFIMVIRLFMKRGPKILSYGLWSIPFIRLIFPFSFESVFSLISINQETIPENIIYSQKPQIESGLSFIDRTVNNVLPVADIGASVNPIQIWIAIGSWIWLGGLIILLIYSIISTLKLSRKLRSARLIKDNIYRIDTIKTPFVFGLIRPRIYLPNNLSKDEESYIIKHEETHIKRKDHIIKFIAFLIVSLHWFNPLVWLGFFLMGEDMELSCDEAVLKDMGYGIKRDYSKSLLSLSTGRRIIGGSPLAFGENNTKTRIKNILNYKEPKFWVVLIGIILFVVLAVGLLTNRPKDETIVRDNYINEEYGFSFEIPDAWKEKIDKVKIVEAEDGSSVTFKYLFEYGGIEEFQEFFSISVMSKDEYTKAINDPQMTGYFLAEKDEEVYLLYEPLDNIIIDKEEREEFQEMFLSTDDIVERFYLSDGARIGLDIKTGLYVTNDSLAHLLLEGNERFTLQRHIATSYIPSGTYLVEANKLLLYVDGNPKEGIIEFIIDGDRLIFNSGELADGLIEKGTQFIHTDSREVQGRYINTEGDYTGYITGINLDENLLYLDEVEFLTVQDEDRLGELGIDKEEDMPSGFIIYNPEMDPIEFKLRDDTDYVLLNWTSPLRHISVSKDYFMEYNQSIKDNDRMDYNPLYSLFIDDGSVILIKEEYLP